MTTAAVALQKPKRRFKLTKRVFSYPYVLFMLLFVVIPLVMILVNAFLDADNNLTLDNFADFFTDKSSLIILANSLLVGVITTAICLIIGYPLAYILSKMPSGRVLFGMVYNYLPFMILPLHTTLSSIDRSYIEAAQDLGADSSTVFLKTVLPLSVSGIISGITMVFIPTISTFAISQLLSNGKIFLFGDSIQMKFEQGLYGVGSIMSLVMLAFVLISNFIINRASRKSGLSIGRSLW